MLKVAKRFDVSSSYMARVCTNLNVPRPARGYWAKLAVGKVMPKRPLPEASPIHDQVWRKDGIGTRVPLSRLPKAPVPRLRHIPPIHDKKKTHELIVGAKEHFESGRLSYQADYLKPAKRLLVDLAVTKPGLDKALSFANELFLELERRSHRVVIASVEERFHREQVDEREDQAGLKSFNNLWTPGRSTVVYVDSVAIGLTVIEMSEEVDVRYVKGEYIRESEYVFPKGRRNWSEHTWTTKKHFSSGRLCLQVYSPYWLAKWNRAWRETKNNDLVGRIPSIVKELEKAATEIAKLVDEGQRKEELERQRRELEWAEYERRESERKYVQALKDSKEELLKIINKWTEEKHTENFLNEVQLRCEELGVEERKPLLEKLELARKSLQGSSALKMLAKWRAPLERK
ncbi:hypothetical protein [Oxalicibacterium faecigallinarum]|uniref:Uncharacterized protein n=1 Tax=Oxalicibacterium faecigallinarum TaxID=573741 RepID=A0A8J3AY68_9BURK|nr:hypothetical protein [Oxalicibacterium faecigallinarum]GGI19154.1 hypothetical protein GCM10008066_17660 [Oxalicibacterium faecigallinarum]